jgi:gas vesicle protein
MQDNSSGAKFLYFLTGVSIGALIGILFAPQSGKETRDYIVHRTDEGREYLSKKGRQIREQATDYLERGKGVISEQKEHLAAAIEAGKQAYRAESHPKGSTD